MKETILSLILFVSSFAFSQQTNLSNQRCLPIKNRTVVVYTSADHTSLRLTKTDDLNFSEQHQFFESKAYVFVNPKKTFQTIMGIGGAITDASAEVFAKLGKEKQNELLEAYYSKEKGIGYSIIRTTINSSDFSSDSYCYVKEGDKTLKTFNIGHDEKYKIPFIKRAIETAGGKELVYVSPWSPPAFMKDNNNMINGGKLLPAFYQTWADYVKKFIDGYQREGIQIWGLTVQNEPMATQRWESCIYTAEEERDFLKYYLGPTLAKAGYGSKKIIIWDHNRDMISQRVTTILEDPQASKYVWGIGFHWYESWNSGEQLFGNIKMVNEMYPDKKLIFTEGCVEKFNKEQLQFWGNGEQYGRSMINDFNNGVTGWTDWNILLDEKGGPNHANNYCFAPIHGDTNTGELIYTPSYFFIGHFSKFIEKNAKRISSISNRIQLLTTSFINPDGKIITVVMNQSDRHISYNLCVGTKNTEVSILPHAIQTLLY
ncbi:MAG: glycoside hydrolase family 30 protein [Bacteroidota bacterium]|nr:glycoside hydrolase family 30 protein [Bacteroidota bacterium]